MSNDPSKPADPAPGTPPDDAGHDGTIPLEPAPEAPKPVVPVARPAGKPLLDLVDDTCPNCKAVMDADALVCMTCGFDMKQNRVIKPEVGEVDAPEAPKLAPEFVRPGGTAKIVAILGGATLLAATVCAWLSAPRGAGAMVSASLSLLTIYKGILHTGTGVAAVWLTARWVSERFSRVDLASARMLLGFSVYLLVASLPLHMEMVWLERSLKFVVGMGAYYLMLWALFRRDRMTTMVLLAFHVAMWAFVEFGILIASQLEQAVQNAPRATP